MQHLQENKGGVAVMVYRFRGPSLGAQARPSPSGPLASRNPWEEHQTAEGVLSELGLCYPKHDLNLTS